MTAVTCSRREDVSGPRPSGKRRILYSLNKPDDFILAIVEFRDDDTRRVHYVRQPFQREPDFDAASVNYTLKDLLARAEAPRSAPAGYQEPSRFANGARRRVHLTPERPDAD